MPVNLRIAKVTTLYVYLEWDVVPGACGYWIFKNGQRVTWTANPTQVTTRFLKPISGSASFSVMPIFPGELDTVSYPPIVPVARKADPLIPLRGA